MSDWPDELTRLVEDNMDDIIFDHVNYATPVKTEIKTKELRVLDVGTDDGLAYGHYLIVVNGGAFEIELTAQAAYAGFVDKWDWAGESHYTQDVTFEELQDYEHEITAFRINGEQAIDKMVDAEVDSQKEKRP